jgi:hypothetical protein
VNGDIALLGARLVARLGEEPVPEAVHVDHGRAIGQHSAPCQQASGAAQ